MRKFIQQAAVFLTIALSLFVLFKLSSDYWIRKNATLNFSKKVDKAVIGHSHSECAINDSKVDGLVNISQSGESYLYTYFKTQFLLSRNDDIKTVFIEFANNQVDLHSDRKIWERKYVLARYPVFGPFMGIKENELLARKNFKEYFRGFSLAAKRNFNFILEGDYEYVEKMGGYKKLTKEEVGEELGVLNDEKDVDYSKNMTMSNEGLSYLDKTLELCKEKGIKVYLIRSPLHPKYPGLKNEEFYQQVLKSRYADLELIDFKDFPLEDSEFADLQHLNYKGAKKFSLFFDSLLKNGLLEKENKQAFIDEKIASKLN